MGSAWQLNIKLTSLRDAGKTDAVLQLVQTCHDQRLVSDRVSYNITLSALERSSRWQEAAHMFTEMSLQGFSANIISFNTLLGALARGKKWQLGLNLLSLEKAPNWPTPDAVSIGTGISACALAMRWSVALALLEQLGRFPERATARRAAVTSALWACGSASRWQQGLSLLGPAMPSLRPDAALLGAAVSACALGQAWEWAIALLCEAERRSLSNEAVQRSGIAACELGAWQTALLLLHKVHRSRSPAGISSAISAVAKATEWELAISLLEEMPRPAQAGANAAVEALAIASKWAKSLELLHTQRSKAASGFPGLSAAAVALTVCQHHALPDLIRQLYSSSLRNWLAARGTAAQDPNFGNLVAAADMASSTSLPTLIAYSCHYALQKAEPLQTSELRNLGPCLVRSAIVQDTTLQNPTQAWQEAIQRFLANTEPTLGNPLASSLVVWSEFKLQMPRTSTKAFDDTTSQDTQLAPPEPGEEVVLWGSR